MGKGDKAQHNGVLIVTEIRAAFYRKGIFREILETMPLKSITLVESKSLLGHRLVRLHASHDDLAFKTFYKDGEIRIVGAIESHRDKSTQNLLNNKEDSLYKLKNLLN